MPSVSAPAAVRPDGHASAPVLAWSRTYVQSLLAPTLHPGDVVVLDNLAAHKADALRSAVEQVGATLLFLPPYSPDLSPIENAFSKIKHRLRQAAATTFETLVIALQEALASISATDPLGFFCQAGFTNIA